MDCEGYPGIAHDMEQLRLSAQQWQDSLEAERRKTALLRALAKHIIVMADDAYLTGHPEWLAIVAEAERAIIATGRQS